MAPNCSQPEPTESLRFSTTMVEVPGGPWSSADRPLPQPISQMAARSATSGGRTRIAASSTPRPRRHPRRAEVSLRVLAGRLHRLVAVVGERHETQGEVLLDDEVEDAVVEPGREVLLHVDDGIVRGPRG